MLNSLRWVWTLALVALSAAAADRPIKVACVGDSITVGVGTKDQKTESYPAQLARMLGEKYEVKGFGVSGSTLLKKGDKPYWNQTAYEGARSFAPDIVILMLGTNDTKPQNWKFKADFAADYKALVESFSKLPSKPKVYACRPVPVPGKGNFGINETALQEQIPMIDAVAAELKLTVIDMHASLEGKDALLPDRVHPNADGAKAMAEAAHKVLAADAEKK